MIPAAFDRSIIEDIHASGRSLVLAITGGGSAAISRLLTVPGASASVLEAIVPYSARALDDWVGGPVEQYCSEVTARAMAMRAFERARELSDGDPYRLGGVGATASLATNRPKRGAHRIHVAWQSATTTALSTCDFDDPNKTRDVEEDVSMQMVLAAAAEACGLPSPPVDHGAAIDVLRRKKEAPRAWTELLLGVRSCVEIPERADSGPPKILFPGAFNPPHWGHERMAEVASKRCGAPVTFEISMMNVDKLPLDFIEIEARLSNLRDRPILLTRAPTFVEKSRLAPGCAFVAGVDTIQRIADPIYYRGDIAKRDAAIAEIAEHGCRFLVFGRSLEGRFTPLAAVDIPAALRAICEEVPESEFAADVSSTELRVKSRGD